MYNLESELQEDIQKQLLRLRDHKRAALKWVYSGIICIALAIGLCLIPKAGTFEGVYILLSIVSLIPFFPLISVIENYWEWKDKGTEINERLRRLAEQYIETTKRRV